MVKDPGSFPAEAWASPRRWLQAPGFTLALLLTVTVVVTLNASAFAAWWALLFKPLGIQDEQRWVELRIDLRDINFQVGLSPSIYQGVRGHDHFEEAIGAAEMSEPQLDSLGRSWRVQRITANFATALAVPPLHGTAFAQSPENLGQNDLLLSHRMWEERFNADPTVLGSLITIGAVRYRLVGVMPLGFAWPDAEVQAWTPWQATPEETEQDSQGGFGQFHVWARMAPQVTVAQASSALASVVAHSGNTFLKTNSDRALPQARLWRERFSATNLPALLMLQAAAALLLLVAAANVSALTLDRLWSERQGYAIRHTLGANARKLLALILLDLSVPALLGASLGLLLTPSALGLLESRGLLPEGLPITVGNDLPTVMVALLSAAIAISIAAVTALAVIRRFVKAGSLNQVKIVSGLGRVQVIALVAQITLTTVLAGATALLLRSSLALADEPRGFDADGVLLTQYELPKHAPKELNGSIREALAALPGVDIVATGTMPPFGGSEFISKVTLRNNDQPIDVNAPEVGAGYFRAMRMPFLAGRDFTAEELRDGGAVIVDETFWRQWLSARALAPATASDVSLQFIDQDMPGGSLRIVGVVPSVKQKSLLESHPLPAVYSPMPQGYSGSYLISRTALDARQLSMQVQRLLAQLAPEAQLVTNSPLADAVSASMRHRLALAESVTIFAAATLMLASLGLYAVLNAAVSRRRAEFGVRLALGCAPQRLRRAVLLEASALLGVGLVLGLVSGTVLAQLLAEQLYRIPPGDLTSWLAAALVVASTALAACWRPAHHASELPPSIALNSAP